LSAQAQKLSQSQTSTNSLTYSLPKTSNDRDGDNGSAGNVKSVPKEANEATGIQFIAGESKGGRISTYA
jgi:hypothetical protein